MDFDIEAIKNNPNYMISKIAHQNTFREVFSKAFSESEEGQVILTLALTKISSRDFKGGIELLEQLDSFCVTGQDEASLSYFKGLAYDFLNEEEKMEENYDAFLEQNTVLEPIYIFLPYVRRAKLLHKACMNMKSYEYFCKVQRYFEKQGRENENNISLCNLYFDLANNLLFCHSYNEALEYANKAHIIWKNDEDNGHKIVEMIILFMTNNIEKSKMVLDSIDGNTVEYKYAEQMLQKLINKEEPHYFPIEPREDEIDDFWKWFLKNQKKLYQIATGDNFENFQAIVSKRLLRIFDYMQRELALSLEINGESITVIAYTDYVTGLEYGYKRLFERKPEKLSNWDFIVAEEMSDFD